ncbi:hypothetical protein IEQ34_007088 [Dendrobium chrysotoxum]|uniref:Uncharacterized protein n=1 Tax=Dendrobium chrysotoxum TaxID=161865 RepID=A0AAV7H7C6_DENCH|nr:hypothetical protein IEQ34_007088 [Dendrobium chrysotoxum]
MDFSSTSLHSSKISWGAKPKMFAAYFTSPDRSKVLSVFPDGANLYAARTYRIKEKALRTHYFYEFEIGGQHVSLAV